MQNVLPFARVKVMYDDEEMTLLRPNHQRLAELHSRS